MNDLIHNLGIEWKVLIAQMVNFGILLFLLKKFAYKPILKVLADRRARIEDAIAKSKSVEEKMQAIEELKNEVLDKARRQSEDIIKEAHEAAKKMQDKTIAETQVKAEKVVADARVKLTADRDKMLHELKGEIAEVVASSIEKTVGDIFDKKTQEKLVTESLQLIRNHKTHAKK